MSIPRAHGLDADSVRGDPATACRPAWAGRVGRYCRCRQVGQHRSRGLRGVREIARRCGQSGVGVLRTGRTGSSGPRAGGNWGGIFQYGGV